VSPYSSYDAPSTSWDMATISTTGPIIVVGSAKAQGLKAKTASRVKAAQSNQSEGQSNTRGGQQLVHPEPYRGDPTSSSFISESQPRGFLHTLCVGWHRAVRVNPLGITQERRLKPSGPDLAEGGH
jgi:hypothetical protein